MKTLILSTWIISGLALTACQSTTKHTVSQQQAQTAPTWSQLPPLTVVGINKIARGYTAELRNEEWTFVMRADKAAMGENFVAVAAGDTIKVAGDYHETDSDPTAPIEITPHQIIKIK